MGVGARVGGGLCNTLSACGDPPFGSTARGWRRRNPPCHGPRSRRHRPRPDGDPPKQLAIGPDHAGNLVEVIVLLLADERLLAIHAMRLRPKFYDLLPSGEDSDA